MLIRQTSLAQFQFRGPLPRLLVPVCSIGRWRCVYQLPSSLRRHRFALRALCSAPSLGSLAAVRGARHHWLHDHGARQQGPPLPQRPAARRDVMAGKSRPAPASWLLAFIDSPMTRAAHARRGTRRATHLWGTTRTCSRTARTSRTATRRLQGRGRGATSAGGRSGSQTDAAGQPQPRRATRRTRRAVGAQPKTRRRPFARAPRAFVLE